MVLVTFRCTPKSDQIQILVFIYPWWSFGHVLVTFWCVRIMQITTKSTPNPWSQFVVHQITPNIKIVQLGLQYCGENEDWTWDLLIARLNTKLTELLSYLNLVHLATWNSPWRTYCMCMSKINTRRNVHVQSPRNRKLPIRLRDVRILVSNWLGRCTQNATKYPRGFANRYMTKDLMYI